MKNTLVTITISLYLISLFVYVKDGYAGGYGAHHHAVFGKPGDPHKAARIIYIEAADNMRFNPSGFQVKRGETIKFIVRNVGSAPHEFVLGDAKSLREHAEMMRKFPDMEHADPNQVRVNPGETGEVIWHFTKAGKFEFACLIPGHYEAGMVGVVVVKKS